MITGRLAARPRRAGKITVRFPRPKLVILMHDRYLRAHDPELFPAASRRGDPLLAKTLLNQAAQSSSKKRKEHLQNQIEELEALSATKRPHFGLETSYQYNQKEQRQLVWDSLVKELRKEAAQNESRFGKATQSMSKREVLLQNLRLMNLESPADRRPPEPEGSPHAAGTCGNQEDIIVENCTGHEALCCRTCCRETQDPWDDKGT